VLASCCVLWRTLALVALIAAVVTSAADAAQRKPRRWQWTPAQASGALVAAKLKLEMVQGFYSVKTAKCRGTGNAVAGRFSSFKCAATLRGQKATNPTQRTTVFAKVRRVGAGQVCASLSTIPAGCLDPSGAPRATTFTSVNSPLVALRRALAKRLRTKTPFWQGDLLRCPDYYGAGFWTCEFGSASEKGGATVIVTTRGDVVKITTMVCVSQPERPGCKPG